LELFAVCMGSFANVQHRRCSNVSRTAELILSVSKDAKDAESTFGTRPREAKQCHDIPQFC